MSKYEIKISEDAMIASLKLIDDGKPPTIEEIENFLKEKGIIHGIRREVIDEIISTPKYNIEYPIAYGDPPRVGEDARLVYHEKLLQKLNNTDFIQKDIDLKETNQLIIVYIEEELAQVIPPKKGPDGKNVKGEVVEGIPGKDLKLKLGKNVELIENKVISKIDGKFISKEEKNGEIFLDVSDEHKIDGNVDYSTGNIRFPGKIVINGDVKPGFVVEAKTYIEIKGVVEAATIICEGEAHIFGIKGGGKGLIKVESLYCNYIENAQVEVSESVIVKTSIVNSSVKSGKSIIVEGSNGRISGGTVLATNLIEADILGSEGNVKTICEVGISPELNQELVDLETKVALITDNLKKLSSILTGLKKLKEKNMLDTQKLEYYKKSVNTFKLLLEELEEIKERLDLLKQKIQSSKESAFIIARRVVYPGVEIIIHKKKFVPNVPVTKVIFKLENDEISMHGYQTEIHQ